MYSVIGAEDCRFCDLAKKKLDSEGYSYKYLLLSEHKFLLDFFKLKGYTTVPQIFLGDQHVGGYEDLKDHLTAS